MKIIYKKIEELKKYSRNVTIHDAKHVNEIMASIEEFGWTVPILIDENNEIVAGHGRYEAAKLLEAKEVPVIIKTDWSDAQVKAYRIADNQLTRNPKQNMEMLHDEVLDIMQLLEENDEKLSLYVTGLDHAFIESLQKTEEDFADYGDDDEAEKWEETEREDNILVKISIPATVWLGSRSELMDLFDKLSKKYLSRVSVNE